MAVKFGGPCKINTPIEAREYDHWKMIRTKFRLEHNMANTSNLYEKLHLKMCRSILGVNKKPQMLEFMVN